MDLMWLPTAHGTCPSHLAPGPAKREDNCWSSFGAVKWVDLLSLAIGGLGRTLWPLGLDVCRMRDVFQEWNPNEMLPQAAAPLCVAATEEGDPH